MGGMTRSHRGLYRGVQHTGPKYIGVIIQGRRENHMEKKVEHEMDTELIEWFIGILKLAPFSASLNPTLQLVNLDLQLLSSPCSSMSTDLRPTP